MKLANELSLDIDEIRGMLGIVDNRPITFPEIICNKLLETNVSKWIAYLLNPKYNRYALSFMNIIMRKLDIPECDSTDIDVFSECMLDEDSRIDVYITSPKYIVGIEVKLNASETNDQTERYHEIITSRCRRDNKKPVEVYLKPSFNTQLPKCQEFRIVTFMDILPELHKLSQSLPIDRDHMILDEFIGFLEVGPERARQLSLLPEEYKKALNSYHRWLYKDIFSYLADYGYIKIDYYHPEKEGFGYIQLKRKDAPDWKKTINFHYELLWHESHYLALNKKMVLAVHLEPSTKTENRREIIKFFNADLLDGRTLFGTEINVDFTSAEKSHKTLDRIIRILGSKEVAKWGDVADRCIESLFGQAK